MIDPVSHIPAPVSVRQTLAKRPMLRRESMAFTDSAWTGDSATELALKIAPGKSHELSLQTFHSQADEAAHPEFERNLDDLLDVARDLHARLANLSPLASAERTALRIILLRQVRKLPEFTQVQHAVAAVTALHPLAARFDADVRAMEQRPYLEASIAGFIEKSPVINSLYPKPEYGKHHFATDAINKRLEQQRLAQFALPRTRLACLEAEQRNARMQSQPRAQIARRARQIMLLEAEVAQTDAHRIPHEVIAKGLTPAQIRIDEILAATDRIGNLNWAAFRRCDYPPEFTERHD